MSIQRGITLINLALITLGCYFGVSLFYQVVAIRVQHSGPVPQALSGGASDNASVRQNLSYYKPILDRDLFKTSKIAQTATTAQTVNLENLEETNLKLKLWGTVTGDPERAYAVIEDIQKREQNLYRIGDSVQNATVKMIMREKVVLSVNGKDEVLAMEEVTQTGLRPAIAARRFPAVGLNSGVTRPQRISLRRNMIDEAMQDVSKLMTEIAVRPHLENAQPAGLSLSHIKPNSIFRRMGLRNGDILMGVDGQEIRSVDDALKLYENLKAAPSVTVQLKRRGQERTINYNIR